jgi:hypothetical protein
MRILSCFVLIYIFCYSSFLVFATYPSRVTISLLAPPHSLASVRAAAQYMHGAAPHTQDSHNYAYSMQGLMHLHNNFAANLGAMSTTRLDHKAAQQLHRLEGARTVIQGPYDGGFGYHVDITGATYGKSHRYHYIF